MKSATPSGKAAMKSPAVEATAAEASTRFAGEAGRGRRECKPEANNLTECCCFHAKR